MRFIYTKTFIIFFALLAAVVLLSFLRARGTFAPVEDALAEAPRPITYIFTGTIHAAGDFFSYFGSAHNLSSTNAQLRDQVRTLQAQLVDLSQDKLENQVLRQELNYRQNTTLNIVSAQVIGNDPTGFTQEEVANVGSSSGIKAGDAVLAQGVLVGRITEVAAATSKFTLVTDPSSSIDVQLGDTGEHGILKGSYGSGTIIDSVSPKAAITTGEQVVTAGLTSDMPAKILVGSVGEILSNKSDLLQRATVVSAVDIKNLQFVGIVK